MRAVVALQVGLLFVLVQSVAARTITVGKAGGHDYTTIQAAINAATSGDEIIVSSGTYVENFNFLGKNLLLRSTDPTSAAVVAATVIDGNQAGSVVTFAGSEASSCVLAGFTIRNGRASSGGGINGNDSAATIRNNTVTGNAATVGPEACGGGISNCHGLIEENLISGNSASFYGVFATARGGGLYGCNGTISRNIISNNTVYVDEGLAYGGGLAFCGGTIVNNVIADNVASRGDEMPWPSWYAIAFGGGLYDCGAVYPGADGILNDTIWANSARDSGGGLAYCDTIRNCIIYGNSAEFSDPQLYNSATPTYSCIQDWSGGGAGNFASNPGLASGFHLSPDSPCIDAGGTVTLTVDFEGDPRPFDYTHLPRGDGSHFDVGADEVAPTTIAFDSSSLVACVPVGNDPATKTLTIWNAGRGSFAYTVVSDQSWLTVTPGDGFSSGPTSRTSHRVAFRTASFPAGDYAATITITAPGAVNNPARIPVRVFIGGAVTVTEPAGGETWFRGAVKQIEWQSQGSWDWVTVYLKRPGYQAIMATAPNHAGSNRALVRLPQDVLEAGDYVIGVAWTCCPTQVYDESSTLTLRPLVAAITWPTSGTAWSVGTSGTVTWTCVNLPAPGQMDLDLWQGGRFAGYLARAACQNGANTATVRLPVGSVAARDYRVRLVWAEDTSVTFQSEPFIVTRPTGAVTWPTTGTVWARGTLGTVTWTCAVLPGLSQVDVYLEQAGAPASWLGRVPCQNGSNSARVRLPADSTVGSNGQLRLRWIEDPTVAFWSGTFTVGSEPTCQITWPTTGSVWYAGMLGPVRWTCANFPASGRMDLGVWRDGVFVKNFARVPFRNGTNNNSVRLPNDLPGGTAYQIGFSWVEDSSITFLSVPFTVRPVPTCRIVSPNAATQWRVRREERVDWQCTGFPAPGQLALECWKDNVLVKQLATVAFHDGDNTTTFVVPLDLAPGDDYQLRLFWTFDRAISGASDTFTIARAIPLILTVGKTSGYDFSTIQEAINYSLSGDQIIVAKGGYAENIRFQGRNIILRSTDPLSTAVVASTLIDGHVAGSVVTFAGTEESSCVLAGFTLARGFARYGGGICGNGTSATIRNNVIFNNTAYNQAYLDDARGGGLFRCHGLIENNAISGNLAYGRDEISGGGFSECNGTIRRNRVFGNRAWAAVDDAYGGGFSACLGTIEDNLIYDNRVQGSREGDSFGGGLCNCQGLIQNNAISSNSATGTAYAYGGGLWNCDGVLMHNTIWGNRAQVAGGGLSACGGTIRNCIVWANTAPTSAQLHLSSLPSYSCIQDWTGGGTGNLSDDPQLTDPARGDFHLLPASLCIDAGGTVALQQDFEGDPRPYRFAAIPRGDGSNFDMGADEVTPGFTITWPATGVVWKAWEAGNVAFTCRYFPSATQADVELWKDGRRVAGLGRVACQNGSNVVAVYLPVALLGAGGTGYQIRLLWAQAPAVTGWSRRFSVTAAPSFAITWPRAESVWQAGKTAQVSFTCANLPAAGQASVELWRSGRKVRALALVPCKNGDNLAPVRLPSNLVAGPNYQIRMYWAQYAPVSAASEYFRVIGATVRLGVPRFDLYR